MTKKLVLCEENRYNKEFEELVIDKKLKFPYKYFTDNLKEFNIEYFFNYEIVEVDISKDWTILYYQDCGSDFPYVMYLEKENNNFWRAKE